MGDGRMTWPKPIRRVPCTLAGPLGRQARWPGPVMAITIDGVGPLPAWFENEARARYGDRMQAHRWDFEGDA